MIEELPAHLGALADRAAGLVRQLDLVMLPRTDAEAPDSVRRFTLVERQLRALRREVALAAREVRAYFRAEGVKVSSPAPLVSPLHPLGRPDAATRRLPRQQLARQRQTALGPLEHLAALIDRARLQAAQLRLRVQQAFPPPVRIRQ